MLGRVKTDFFPQTGKSRREDAALAALAVLTRPPRGAARASPAERGGTEVAMLKIYADALDVVRMTNDVVARIERHDPDLARQLRKARCSIPLNVSEGSHARGARRNLHYGYAKGSAQESIGILETAHACGYIAEVPAGTVDKLKKIVGTLYKCIGGHR